MAQPKGILFFSLVHFSSPVFASVTFRFSVSITASFATSVTLATPQPTTIGSGQTNGWGPAAEYGDGDDADRVMMAGMESGLGAGKSWQC